MTEKVWKEHVFTETEKKKFMDKLSLELSVNRLKEIKLEMENLIENYISKDKYRILLEEGSYELNKGYIEQVKLDLDNILKDLDRCAEKARKQEVVVLGKYNEINNLNTACK